MSRKKYDIVVIGGGHAGVEAAWCAARMGCSAALVTMDINAIGRMSCNPAIGGLGKGQMVREIDALGGLMALAIDRAGIQFRMLNRSKGPAVWAPRAQADRTLYTRALLELLQSAKNLELINGTAGDLLADRVDGPPCGARWRIKGIRLEDGRELLAQAVVVTAGTFLRGLMHCGPVQTEGGRIGEPAAKALSNSMEQLGLTLARLKTGTPARVHRDSISPENLERQPGDVPPVPFSFMTGSLNQPQVECWITYTNQQTHDVIRLNVDRAPLYSGQIKSRGPRYCPSIEDKVMRFADKDRHQVFLEPEGYDSEWIYCNGISTSLPTDVQDAIIHSIEGLERASIVQYGYAIEYDWVPTDQIDSTLQTKPVAGLFLAGQVNGTSGYEEAAGQGLLAGINAVAYLRRSEPVVLGRNEAYIGVMIDDIVTRPPDEPYRMFTSRAEYRLNLRSDNADRRLTEIGRRVGLVDDQRWAAYQRKRETIDLLETQLRTHRVDGTSLYELLRRPHIRLAELIQQLPNLSLDSLPPTVLEAVEINTKYAGYLEREQRQIERHKQLEARRIPDSFDFMSISELRYEARERFTRFRPRSLGQAARMTGISPADIATLSVYLLHRQRQESVYKP